VIVAQPHDALFRVTFAQIEHARPTLALLLPASVSRHVDWSTLELLPGSFVDGQLASRVTDLLYAAHLRQGSEVRVHLLFEHQSEVEPFMALRLLEYEVNIWRAFHREHGDTCKLPPIVPVLLHHSEGGWSASTHFDDLLGVDGEARTDLAPFLPAFRFVLEDLGRRESQDLHDLATTALARIAFFCLRDARNDERFGESLPCWADLYHEVSSALNGVEAASAILRYIHQVTELDRGKVEERLLEALGPEAKEAFVTLAEREFAQGVQKGRQEGRREALVLVVEKLLELKFGALSAAQRARIATSDEATLEQMSQRVLNAESLDAVLRGDAQ